MDWLAGIKKFKDFDVKFGKWRLEWCYLGEGNSGDFDPEDPDDTPLLRADLYCEGTSEDDMQDGSYCTLANVLTPKAKLIEGAMELLQSLPDKAQNRNFKRLMEQWTWRSYD